MSYGTREAALTKQQTALVDAQGKTAKIILYGVLGPKGRIDGDQNSLRNVSPHPREIQGRNGGLFAE